MIDINVLVNARPDVEPLSSVERDRLSRDVFESIGDPSGSRSRTHGHDGLGHGRRNVGAVAAAGIIVVGGLVAIGSIRSDPDPQTSSSTFPASTTSSSQLPPPTETTALGRTLTVGATGDEVLELQQQLRELGFDPGPSNGNFGIETASAVWAFERLVLGVEPDRVTGDVTPQTWEAIDNAAPVTPRRPGAAGVRHLEVYLPEQVLALFDGPDAVLIGPISSGSLDASGQPEAFCETSVVDLELSGEAMTVPVERSVCGETYTPAGVFSVGRIVDGTHTSAVATMTDAVFFNYGIAAYGTNDLPKNRSTRGGIATPLHLASRLANSVSPRDEVLIWDGVREPEDQDDVSSLPVFPRPDPNVTAEATSATTLPCGQEGADGDITHADLANLSAEVATLTNGSVGIVVTDSETGQHVVGGCIPEETAALSRSEGLSLAYVTPVADGVFVAVAVPEGRNLAMPDAVIRTRSTTSPAPTGFDLVILDAEELGAMTDLGLSATQLQNLVTNAATSSTIATAGLAPDLLQAE